LVRAKPGIPPPPFFARSKSEDCRAEAKAERGHYNYIYEVGYELRLGRLDTINEFWGIGGIDISRKITIIAGL